MLRTFLLLIGLIITAWPAFAVRTAPKMVAPVVIGAIEYSAPSDEMGFVIAADAIDHRELWRQRIYRVWYLPFKERDVQEVYINSLAAEDGLLVITNEKGRRYTLDPLTRKVSERK